MNASGKYSIPFKGLGEGLHHYEFDLDDAFFAAFDGSEVKRGTARVDVELDRKPNMLRLQTRIAGEVFVECDRCLDDLGIPVDYRGGLIVRFADRAEESDGEIMWLEHGESELDLAQYIYESIVLGLPYQRVHPDDANGNSTCDPGMLSKFTLVSEDDFERITASRGGKTDGDLRWEKLKEFKGKLK